MARTKYGYAESSEIKATNAGHIVSGVNADNAIENGTLWVLGNKTDGSDEIYAVTKPTATSDQVWLALSALYAYDTSTTLGQHEMYLRKEAGEPARMYELVKYDRYAIADYMITPLASSGPVVGNYLIPKTDGTYTELASSATLSNYGFVARINSIEYKSNLTIVRIEVVQN